MAESGGEALGGRRRSRAPRTRRSSGSGAPRWRQRRSKAARCQTPFRGFVLSVAFALLCLLCHCPQALSGSAGACAFAAAEAETAGASVSGSGRGGNGVGAGGSVLLFEREAVPNGAAATAGGDDAEHDVARQHADGGDPAGPDPRTRAHRPTRLRFTEEGRKFLAGLQPPFAFVSAVGDTRTGKSTLLSNAFMRGNHSVFPTGTGVVSHTRGVHATTTPKIIPHGSYGNISVYFVDTEGFHGVETLVSKTYEANLFSFMTLLSSTMVYTTYFPMNANDVHRMKSFAALANLFFTFSDLHSTEVQNVGHDGSAGFGSSEKAVATRLAMGKRPRLVWAAQNFNLANLANSGRTVDEFLDTLLSGTLLGRKDMDLQLLRSMFSDIRLVPIPRPSNDDGVLANMDRLRDAGYLPGYKDALESLSKVALENITPVAFDDGMPMSGRQFLKAFDWWVNGEGLEVEERSTWLSTVLSKLEVSGRGHADNFRRYAEDLLSERVQIWESHREAAIVEAGSAGRQLPPAMRQERLDLFKRNLTEFREAEALRLEARITRLGLESSKVPAYAQFAAVDGPSIQRKFEDEYIRRALQEHERLLDALVSHCKTRLESLLMVRSPVKPRIGDARKSVDKLEPVAMPSMCEDYWLRMTLLSRLEHERQRLLRSFNIITEAKGLPHEGTAKEVTGDQRRRLTGNPILEALVDRIQSDYDACPNLLFERAVRRPALAAYVVAAPHARFLVVTVLVPLLRLAFAYLLPLSAAVFTAYVIFGQVRRALPNVVRRASALHRALVEYGLTAAAIGGVFYTLWQFAGGREVAYSVGRTVAGVLDEIEGQLAVVGGLTVLWLFWRSWVKNFA